jgi:hypothetical protein
MPVKAGAAARQQVPPAQLTSAGGQRAGEQEAEAEAAELQGQGAEGRCLLFLDVCVAGGGVAGGWRISGPATAEMALLRAVGCGARTPLFDAGAEQSGIVYDVGSFKLPSWSRLPGAPPSGRVAATLVLFPPYHPNFGHFVLDVLPVLWRDGARICQAVRRGSVASDKKQALHLLVLLPPPAPPLPPQHLILLEGVMRAALAREPGCQGLLPSHRELRLVVRGMHSTDEVSCHSALLSCCSGSGIGTQPPGHPLFDGKAVRGAVAAAAAHAAFLSKELAPAAHTSHPGVLIITRSDKRRITNEAALVARCRALPAVQALGGCALIDLGSTDDAKRNVEKLHSAAVLVGVFGAGLTNALFLGGGAGVAGWRAAVIEIMPFRFEECVAWSSFYRALFEDSASLGRVRRYEQLRTAAAAQSSVQCRFLPERLRHPLPPLPRQQELDSECSAEWLDAMPPGSFADCHVSNDPERLALVLRDQDTAVDVEAFEAALERASQAVAVADLSL